MEIEYLTSDSSLIHAFVHVEMQMRMTLNLAFCNLNQRF